MADEQRVRGKHEDRERGPDRVKVALAVSDPSRNRWPDEPEERYEDKDRDGFGRFLRDRDGKRLRYDDTGEAE
jgi:hypothetical protein